MQGEPAEAIGEGRQHEDLSRNPVVGTSGRSLSSSRLFSSAATGFLFFTTFLPIGLVLRALGQDPLRLRHDRHAASYWIARDRPGPAPETMKNPF